MTHLQSLTVLCGQFKISRKRTLFIEMSLKDTLKKSSDQLEWVFGSILLRSTTLISLLLFVTSQFNTTYLKLMINSKESIILFLL